MNRRHIWSIFIAIGLAGCGKSDSPLMAKVGSSKVTLDDIQDRFAEMPAYQQYAASPEGLREFVRLMVKERVLLHEAKATGLDRQPAYKAALTQYDEQAKARRKTYERDLLVESFVRKLQANELKVTDADVEKYYAEHRQDFEKPLQVQAQHILLSTAEEAQAALGRLKAGEPFEKVARQMSKDPGTRERGGQLTPFRRGELVPEFEEAAFRMKTGELAGPIQTQFGFHIIKKIGQRELPAQSFDSVKENIRTRLQKQKFDQWVAAKQASLGVQINDQALAQATTAAAPHP